MCTNPECKYNISDSFKFVNKGRRTTNATDMLIVYAYRDLMETAASIANRFHVSDTHEHEVFDRYVKMDRLPLTDAICIDEVFLDMDEYCKYALVIQDFHSGGPIESLNQKAKDLNRSGRGYRNFEHFRNRFLYATREAPVLNGVTDYNPVLYFEDDDN